MCQREWGRSRKRELRFQVHVFTSIHRADRSARRNTMPKPVHPGTEMSDYAPKIGLIVALSTY